ncbi:MAG: hypothetical protein AAGA31_16695 [Bacteroidota bacterium]
MNRLTLTQLAKTYTKGVQLLKELPFRPRQVTTEFWTLVELSGQPISFDGIIEVSRLLCCLGGLITFSLGYRSLPAAKRNPPIEGKSTALKKRRWFLPAIFSIIELILNLEEVIFKVLYQAWSSFYSLTSKYCLDSLSALAQHSLAKTFDWLKRSAFGNSL